ncbi:MAG: YggS family pyridoxal phosphate enzyme [Acidimicrobiales bacterium]|nr:YggS family pyridoxal phosphate enzyme [Acidimicrobiales bacterium]
MTVPLDREAIAANHRRLLARIATGAPGRSVRLVAVTKGFGEDAVRAALDLGLHDLGENYAQELLAKAAGLGGDARIRWRFLGRLQRNKVRGLAPVVAVWESVDRPELVDEIARRAPGASVYVQANLSGEAQKGGAEMGDVAGLVARARSAGLAVDGLMGVAPAGPPEAARPGFRALVDLADELGVEDRSIGMSNDLDVALEEGATEVRVGTGLFGPRPART